MEEADIHYPEDGSWDEEDIEKFAKSVEEKDYDVKTGGSGEGDKPPKSAGPIVVGIVIFFITVYSIYIQQFQFAGLNCILLVALALGNKAIE